MAIQLADNFSYQGAKPLDARIQYATVAAMKAVADSALYEGCKAYCVETEKEYQWKSGNTVDPTTGKWRESTGGGGDFEKMSQNDVDDIKGAVNITPRVEPFEKMTASDVADIKNVFQIYRPFAGLTMGVGGGYAPLGTINFFDATVAPQDWLACDGSVYNIADYPQLAEWYATQHGASNFYGGDGTTTFAVPDLQGEFLRGTGTNSHTNQGSGAALGVHQDGTEHKTVTYGGGNLGIKNANTNVSNPDYVSSASATNYFTSASTDSSTEGYYTSRPTNTSFLICVKAVVAGEVYSTEERVVGTWIDGKKIYQKTFVDRTPSSGIYIKSISDLSLDTLISMKGMIRQRNDTINAPMFFSNTTYYVAGYINKTLSQIKVEMYSDYYNSDMYITIQYTKTTD